MPAGLSNLTRAPGEEEGVWGKCGGKVEAREQAGVTWRPGELRFEALMRMLDSKVSPRAAVWFVVVLQRC